MEINNNWEEIKSDICSMISDGRLASGDDLPSVRSLVKERNAHHSTVRKAYDAMASEGLIEKRKNQCAIVTKNAADILRQTDRRRFLEADLPAFQSIMKRLNVTWKDLEVISKGPE